MPDRDSRRPSRAAPSSDASEREVEITRRFDAPPEVLWEAWTNPARLTHWWGPDGFSTTTHDMDVRPGGVWTHTMHGPDGTDYPSRAVFGDVVRPRLISYTLDGGSKTERARCEVTWTFVPDGRGTVLSMRIRFPSVAERDRALKTLGVREAGIRTLERLAALVDAAGEPL